MASRLLEIKVDDHQLTALASTFASLGKDFPAAVSRAINHTGDKARTQMVRAVTVQTGLKRKTIVKALKVTSASGRSMSYRIRSAGGNVSLRYFGARETAAGVSAAPRGHRQVYASTFLKGGRFPHRVPLKMNGQVFERTGAGRFPLRAVKSGVFIPEEMVHGQSAASFDAVVQSDLPARLQHELQRAIGAKG